MATIEHHEPSPMARDDPATDLEARDGPAVNGGGNRQDPPQLPMAGSAPAPDGSFGSALADAIEEFEAAHGGVMAENAQSEAQLVLAAEDVARAASAIARAVAEREAHDSSGHRLGRGWQTVALVALTAFSGVASWFAALAIGLGPEATVLITAIITGAEVGWVAAVSHAIKEDKS